MLRLEFIKSERCIWHTPCDFDICLVLYLQIQHLWIPQCCFIGSYQNKNIISLFILHVRFLASSCATLDVWQWSHLVSQLCFYSPLTSSFLRFLSHSAHCSSVFPSHPCNAGIYIYHRVSPQLYCYWTPGHCKSRAGKAGVMTSRLNNLPPSTCLLYVWWEISPTAEVTFFNQDKVLWIPKRLVHCLT